MHYRPVWAEVHLDRIAANVRRLAQCAYPRELMAVVKANAYGHGAEQVARVALASGARRLAVASPEEGRELRRAGIAAPILVLGALLPGQAEPFLEYRLTATVASEEGVAELAHAGRRGMPLRVHIKVDTGMSRLGFLPHQVASVVQRVRRLPGVELEGLFTHLACADDADTASAEEQLARFREVLAACRKLGWEPAQVHAANTAAVLRSLGLPECNIVRVGIGIYGYNPCPPGTGAAVDLQPALELKSRVATVKRVPAGTGVSYGLTYTTPRETTLATLPVGYADGVSRSLGGLARVLIRGKPYRIVGRVCMDQCVVEVGDDPVEVGDEAVLLGRQGNEQVTADEWARLLGTIPYEILCRISSRVPRVYRGGLRA